MKEAITFIKNTQVSIVTTREDLVKEINHFKAFWLSSVGNQYSNTEKTVHIIVKELTQDDRRYLSDRMKG